VTESEQSRRAPILVTGWSDNVANWVPQTTYHAVALVDLAKHRGLCGADCAHIDIERPWTGQGDVNGLPCPKCLSVSRRSATGKVSDPTVQVLDYVARVNDVARRFDRLPVEIVLRALRSELGECEQDDATLTDLARRISRGEFNPPKP
jgi:hypothetical protein